jgi:hypothetical protein
MYRENSAEMMCPNDSPTDNGGTGWGLGWQQPSSTPTFFIGKILIQIYYIINNFRQFSIHIYININVNINFKFIINDYMDLDTHISSSISANIYIYIYIY